MARTKNCPDCDHGIVNGKDCETCNGTGVIPNVQPYDGWAGKGFKVKY